MEIQREASDKLKGITLQKVRALKLAFDMIISNPKAQVHIAIEYGGDVFIYSAPRKFVEENKNYDSKNFSFNSVQVLNTLVYFLDYWLRDTINKSENVFFSFYSTNKTAKEYHTDKIKALNVTFPDKPILELLSAGSLDHTHLIEACKLILLDEYQQQYKGKQHNYATLAAWQIEDWKNFFRQISWNFDMPDHLTVKQELTKSIITYGQLKNIDITGKESFVRAWLRERLEDDQYETDSTRRFLTDIEIENIYYKIKNDQIPTSVYQYIDEDYSNLKLAFKEFANSFIQAKYNALIPGNRIPFFLKRTVKKHSNEVRIHAEHLAESSLQLTGRRDIITGDIGSFITNTKPNFLFGEIGSGKSSLISQFAISQLNNDQLCLFIPVNYLKGHLTNNYKDLFTAIDQFINQNVLTISKDFNFEILLLSQTVGTLVIDGLDELGNQEVKWLIAHLQKLNNNQENITVIATGRPLELQNIVNYNDWNCLTTMDLSEDEIYQLLMNEATINGMDETAAESDTKSRLNFLNTRKQLLSIAKTPLIVCLIRDYLTENLEDESLGTLMYKILIKRLEWDDTDSKISYSDFLQEYPSAYQRERLIALIASEIGISDKQIIHDSKLFELIDAQVTQVQNKNKIVTQAISFYKNVFLQQSDSVYSFTSQPLFEISFSLSLAEKIRNNTFDDEIITQNWRAVSFAVAINRIKGYVKEINIFLKEAIVTLLRYENNTPHAATLVSESKDKDIAEFYIEQMAKLGFRPLYVWLEEGTFNIPDSFSPYVIADMIHLAGKAGFDWFFEEYLNPQSPTHHSDETLITHILKNYFSIKSFVLTDKEAALLKNIIPYHIAAKTGYCGEIFSLLSLVIPQEFSPDERCRLLTEALHDRLLYKKSRELIQVEIDAGHLDLILNGLEIECSKDYRERNPATRLWLELKQGPVNDTILQTAILGAAKGDKTLLDVLIARFGNKPFKDYLTFVALNLMPAADYAAIILFDRYKVTNFYLVARPIIVKSEWNQQQDEIRRKILDQILIKDTLTALDYILKHTPFKKSKETVPELYLHYFIKLLPLTMEIFKQEFLFVVRHMPEYAVLSRYPELRNNFKNLLESHPQYREFLKQATENLDFKLRFNASNILLACFPENSMTELESTIRSAYKRLADNQEWIRFCMKLNYSKETLAFIVNLLDQLPKISKYYALFILYHQGYALSTLQKKELIEGLLGEGQFFDSDSIMMGTDGLKSIGQDENFFDYIIEAFNSPDLATESNASSMLNYYHLDRLSKAQLAKVYLLECQKYSRSLFEFHKNSEERFNDEEFVKALLSFADEYKSRCGQEPLLYVYYQAINGEKAYWLPLIKAFVFEGKHFEPYDLEFTYRWLKSIQKRKKELVRYAGEAAKELLTYPGITDRKDYNNTVAQLAIIAHEFGAMNKTEIAEILATFGCQDDLICALFCRLEEIPANFVGDRSYPDHFNFFSRNPTVIIKEYTPEEVQKLFVDGTDIPSTFHEGLITVLLYGTLTTEQINEFVSSSDTAALFFSIVAFCRNDEVDFKTLLKAGDQIGWPFYRQPSNAYLRATLYLIKEMQINNDDTRKAYIQSLIDKIEASKDVFLNKVDEYFKELFNLNVRFPVHLMDILFKNLIDQSYHLNDDLFYKIMEYMATHSIEDDYVYLSHITENYIKGLLNQQDKDTHHNENIILLWMFSLICFFVEKEAKPHAIKAYLIGLEAIFLFDGGPGPVNENNQRIKFGTRDLLVHSLPLYEKIKPEIFQGATTYGLENGTKEIKAICRVLKGFMAN